MNMYPYNIGALSIHKEEHETGQVLIRHMDENSNPIILIAQPQQGKTQTAIVFLDHVLKSSKLNNIKTECIWITSESDNSLLEQTEDRLCMAGIDTSQDIKIVHRDRLKTLTIDENCDRRIIINDECHLAIGEDGQFNSFMEGLGIFNGQPRSQWDDKKTFVVYISATPFAHKITDFLDREKQLSENERRYQVVVMSVSPDYYSIQHMHDSDRFCQSEPLLDGNNNATKFFHTVMSEFDNYCNVHGPKHLIVRVRGDENVKGIENLINTNYSHFRIKKFDSKSKNISKLSGFVETQYPHPYVVIIRNSFRVGKTIKTTKHIGGWVESRDANADTVAQSLRCLGYEIVTENGVKKNRRFEDTFVVYTNIKMIEKIVEFYNDNDCIPPGRNNRGGRKRRKYYQFSFDKRPTNEEALARIESEGMIIKNKNIGNVVAHKISSNNKHNISQMLIDNYEYQQQYANTLNCYYVDKANKNFVNSFNNLIEKYPNYQNKYILVFWNGEFEVDHINESSIREGTYLSQ